jgi:hypothetical protein
MSQNRRHRTRRKEKTKNKKERASLWLLICLPEEMEPWGFPEKSSPMECTKLYVFPELESMAVWHPHGLAYPVFANRKCQIGNYW